MTHCTMNYDKQANELINLSMTECTMIHGLRCKQQRINHQCARLCNYLTCVLVRAWMRVLVYVWARVWVHVRVRV